MAGDDATPTPVEAALKNVPRRPRSASGTDDPPRQRAEELGPREDARNGVGRGFLGAALSGRGFFRGAPPADEAAATAAAASSSGDRERPLDSDEKQRILKGKMKAAVEDDHGDAARAAAARAGSGGDGKLMGDAIRAHGGNPRKSKKRKEDLAAPFWYGTGNRGQSSTSAGTDLDCSFYKIGIVSDALRNALAGLGLRPDAAAPQRVYGRMLTTSDRRLYQARLQMSCKCKKWGDEYPIYDFLKPKEREAVKTKGLELKAYDRHGEKFKLTCKYLRSNRSIRLINKWRNFLESNDLAVPEKDENNPAPAPAPRDVMVDLWLFRFHETKPEPAEKVGVVVLHYRKGDAAHADAAFDEEENLRRTRMRTRLQYYDDSNDEDEDEPPSPPEPDWGDAVMEDDAAGDANEEGKDDDDAGASGEAPSSEPDDSGGARAGEERQAGGAPSEDADGTKTEEKEACGALAEAAAGAEPASEAGVTAKTVGKEEAGAAKAAPRRRR